MFFNTHKKQGVEVGKAVKNTFSLAFMNSKYYEVGKPFTVPPIVFMDPYVAAYTNYFITLMMTLPVTFNGANWSGTKKKEFIESALAEIGLSKDNIKVYLDLIINESTRTQWDKDGKYSEGADAAQLSILAAHGKLNAEELQYPLIVEARKLTVGAMSLDQDLTGSSGDNASLSASIVELTIVEYLKENFL